MARQLANWLEAYKVYTKSNESPQLFHQWAGVSAIASALRRNVWLDFGYFHYYPNLYVVLVGPPAIKKTTAMHIAKGILRSAVPSVKFAHDSTSREALIADLSQAYSGLLDYSALSVFSGEFGTMLQTSQAAMIDFLTAIHDYNKTEDFVHNTVTRQEKRVVNPFMNMIACTTPEFVNRSLPAYAIGTGFTSRVLFVYCDKVGELIPKPVLSEAQKAVEIKLLSDLRQISMLRGEAKMTKEGEEWYNAWYMGRRAEIEGADPRLAGYIGRKPTHVVRLALVLALAHSDSLLIGADDLASALTMVEYLEPGLRKIFGTVGRNVYAPVTLRIVDQLGAAGGDGLTTGDLLERNVGDVDIDELRTTLQTIITMGWATAGKSDTVMGARLQITEKGQKYSRGGWSETGEQRVEGASDASDAATNSDIYEVGRAELSNPSYGHGRGDTEPAANTD